MAYWLCKQRRRQESSPVMRFDPSFWTLNFPRPMMASVVTKGAESLRVDTVFYRANDLSGLIWESEDKWDHPLLAYETNRDYRHLILRFRWQSDGVMRQGRRKAGLCGSGTMRSERRPMRSSPCLSAA